MIFTVELWRVSSGVKKYPQINPEHSDAKAAAAIQGKSLLDHPIKIFGLARRQNLSESVGAIGVLFIDLIPLLLRVPHLRLIRKAAPDAKGNIAAAPREMADKRTKATS